MLKLRPYQEDVERSIVANISQPNLLNSLAVMPCGSGKTVLFSKITNDFDGPVALIVHRQELVAQISLTLASFGVVHDIVAPKNVVSNIVGQQTRKYGRSFYSPRSSKKVAGVDTVIRRKDHEFNRWTKSVGLWIQDEAHHVLTGNKWGKAAAMFPSARGLGVTATPERADGKGLGRHSDGLFDTLIEGPSLRWMIDEGYLTDYRIYAPPSDVDFSGLKPTASGDYSNQALRGRETKSHIFGDVADHFNRIAAGKQGITFASSVESARDFAEAFRERNVEALMIHGGSKDRERNEADARFRRGELRQMTNVDLFGEGYDLPILDCVSMARKTESFALFVQQSTRALRPSYAEGMPLDTREQRLAAIAAGTKPSAIIIDHVGNVQRHAVSVNGVIDLCHRVWTLDGREKRQKADTGDAFPVKTCTNPECVATYDAIFPACPYCGATQKKSERSKPEQVDGDLTELDPSALKQIKVEIERQDAPFYAPQHLNGMALRGARNKHTERQMARVELRKAIALWAGVYRAQGESDQVIMRRFYHTFGVDLLSCQTGTKSQQNELTSKIRAKL